MHCMDTDKVRLTVLKPRQVPRLSAPLWWLGSTVAGACGLVSHCASQTVLQRELVCPSRAACRAPYVSGAEVISK